MTPNRSVSKTSAVALGLMAMIIIAIAAYAGTSLTGKSSETSITCSESFSEFNVIQNGTSAQLNLAFPASPCEHHISMSGFSLTSSGTTSSSISLSGNVYVNSTSPLSALIVYVNGTYETTSSLANSNTRPYTIQYNAVLNNQTVPIIAGMNYKLEFVALFEDQSAATATVNAAG